ncbi:MAG: stage III sporulation protein AA [Oscillospiraceae bacterium]|jgi:stage III sporulation protein AA|nr:stage III sporulation protein AA [Oscillospiraceae bacterium]
MATIHIGSKPFDEACALLPQSIREKLSCVPEHIRTEALEIRLRSGACIAITARQGMRYLTGNNTISELWNPSYTRMDARELEECLRALCGWSVHSYTEEICRGFIPLPGGHRAGLCGTSVTEHGRVVSVRNISSISIRIAREIPEAAVVVCARLFGGNELPGVLFCGAPGAGKTTLLRDLCRRISEGIGVPPRRIALIDERGEMAGMRDGTPSCNVGPNTDVLTGYPKAEAILLAIRSLSPELIICDELGGREDTEALLAGANAGVKFAASVHAGSVDEAKKRPVLRGLEEAGVFDYACTLKLFQAPILYRFSNGEGLLPLPCPVPENGRIYHI